MPPFSLFYTSILISTQYSNHYGYRVYKEAPLECIYYSMIQYVHHAGVVHR